MTEKVQLVKYEKARYALEQAASVDEVKDIRDRALALEAYAKQAKDTELLARATEIKFRAERKAGQMLKEMAEKGERKTKKTAASKSSALRELDNLGVSKTQSSYWQAMAEIPEREFEKTVAEVETAKLTTTKMVRDVKAKKQEKKREENKKLIESDPAPLPNQKFKTIVIDPPWDWGDEGDINQLGRAKPAYHTMSFEQLLELPIAELSEDNAHLYLWITNRSMPKGFTLLEKWGFRYITAITWGKPSYGMGNYFRGQTEHILFGIKGSLSLLRKDVGTLLLADRGNKHSEKPEQAYRVIETCSPGPWVELFAREKRSGWTVWGGEIGA